MACVAGEKLPWRSIVYCHSTAINCHCRAFQNSFISILHKFYYKLLINNLVAVDTEQVGVEEML